MLQGLYPGNKASNDFFPFDRVLISRMKKVKSRPALSSKQVRDQ